MNQLRRKQEEEPATEPPPSRQVEMIQEIRDALVKGQRWRHWTGQTGENRTVD